MVMQWTVKTRGSIAQNLYMGVPSATPKWKFTDRHELINQSSPMRCYFPKMPQLPSKNVWSNGHAYVDTHTQDYRENCHYSCPLGNYRLCLCVCVCVCLSACLPHLSDMRDCTNLILHTIVAGTECQKKLKCHWDWTYTFPHRGQSSCTHYA